MAKQVKIIDGMGDYTAGVGVDAADLMNFVNATLQESCVVSDTDFQVTEKGTGADMSVDVAIGSGYIKNTAWTNGSVDETKFWAVGSDAITNVSIANNTSGNPRIDIIVLRVDNTTPPNNEATNVFIIEAVQGTPAGSPVAPTTPANSKKVAEIAVANGATSIVNANITDTRKYLSLLFHKGRLVLGTTTTSVSGDSVVHINTDDYDDIAVNDPALTIEGASGREKIMLKSFGTNQTNYLETLSGRGTVSSPSQTLAGDFLGGIAGGGIDNTGAEARRSGFFSLKALENFTTTAQGTYAVIALTPTGSTTRSESLTITVDSGSNITLSPPADGDVISIARSPRRSVSTNTYVSRFRQEGWNYFQGDGINDYEQAAIIFPITFANNNINIQITALGFRNTGAGVPTSEASFGGGNMYALLLVVSNITTTGAVVNAFTHNGTAFDSSEYHGFSWVAYGTI